MFEENKTKQSSNTINLSTNVLEEQPKVETNKVDEPPKKEKVVFTKEQKREIIKNVIFVLCCFLLVISFVKIPYVGAFLDSVLLDFLFGWAKYLIYIFLVFLLLCFRFEKLKNLLFSKRKIIIYIICICFFSILFNAISFYVDPNTRDYFDFASHFVGQSGYLTKWKDEIFQNAISFTNYADLWLPKLFSYGGLFGLTFISIAMICTPVFVCIVLLLVIILVSLILFKNKKVENIWSKCKQKIVSKLGGSNSKDLPKVLFRRIGMTTVSVPSPTP